MQLIIVSGLSGAGKSVALRQLEDLGYFCVDNLPLVMIGPLTRSTVKVMQRGYERLALGIDAREAADQIAEFPRYVQRLRDHQVEARVLFLTASDQAILRRYSETRRRHPLTRDQLSLTEAIAAERALLEPISGAADEVIDTSQLNVHELREEIAHRLAGNGSTRLTLNLMSFGFKNGVPDVADYIFDVRCLPNPYWEPGLRKHHRREAPVIEYLSGQQPVRDMIADIRGFLERWLPQIREQDRAYLTVAIGCTGGRHRSVFIADQLKQAFSTEYDSVVVKHRDLQH